MVNLRQTADIRSFPPVPVVLSLDSSLDAISVADFEPVRTAMNDLLKVLVIPGQIELAVQRESTLVFDRDKLFTLTVHNRPCRYPNALLETVRAALTGMPARAKNSVDEIREWLGSYPDAVQFIGGVCVEALKRQPACLLETAQLRSYQVLLNAFSGLPDRSRLFLTAHENVGWLESVLRLLLEARIAVAPARLGTALSGAVDRRPEDAAEVALAAMRTEMIEIHAPVAFLQRLTMCSGAAEQLGYIRPGMRDETGFTFPELRFAVDETLAQNTFAFKINDLRTEPFVGLESDHIMVNDTPQRLQLMNMQAEAVSNPSTLQINSITSADKKDRLEIAGLTTWDIVGHVALSCATVMRQYAGCLLTSDRVDHMLNPEAYWNSKLVEAARGAVSLEAMTRLLRGLVAEGISLRPWRLILETILEGGSLHRLPEPELAAFLRSHLQRIIGNKYAQGTDTLVAYRLAPTIEGKLHGTDDDHEEVIAAIRTELDYLPRTVQVPVILTTAQLRPKLAQVVRQEFPLLKVVAHEDLPPGLNVQAIARIGLDS